MELYAYPRPDQDTGIGVHWTVGYATAVGMSRIRDFWLPELKSLGVKWVKIFNHDGALDFCELLLAEGLMPVVRLYRPSPNPGRLGVKELVHLDAFVRAGVRYFEFNNEPDVDAEWKGGRVPVNALELTVENTVANMEMILERGGMPAVPAVANGSRWDLVGKIVAAGHKDLFDGPVWQAIHNYSRNRPLDYPYDIGNQEGAAFTPRFFNAVAEEQWGEDAWRGRMLAEVNRLRHDRRSPGATVQDDHACFLAYEYFDALNRKHLGRSIPILSTECGYVVGEDADPRYPATSPDLQLAQTLEICRVMMGGSQRFKPAPEYYFCTAFWLLANERLGSTSTWWENHAWYSERWPGGMLPVVPALKAEPKVARLPAQSPVQATVTLRGVVTNAGEHRVIQLERDGQLLARTNLDGANAFELVDLAPGAYVLRVEGAGFAQPVELTAGHHELVLTLHVAQAADPGLSRSVIAGKVRGGAGAVVMLVRASDGEEWVTMARDDGAYRFVNLPAGVYSLRVDPGGFQVDRVSLDGRNQQTVDLAVAGWGYTVRVAEDVQNVGAIVVSTPGRKGVRVQAHAAEWSSEPVLTGTAPEHGDAAALLTPLDVDHYIITVDGVADEAGKPTQLEARVYVDKRSIPLVEFVYIGLAAREPDAKSAVTGRVSGGARTGQPVRVALTDEAGHRQEQSVTVDGHFGFSELVAGHYTVSLVDHPEAAARTEIALDGLNQVEVELKAPLALSPAPASDSGRSIVAGVATDAAGRTVRLLDAVGNERTQRLDSAGQFRFTDLSAGIYTVAVDGGSSESNLVVDGVQGLEVIFAPVISVWETQATNAGSMPGFSVVRVEVEGMTKLPVRIWQGEEEGLRAATGSTPALGAHTVEFKPLGPGLYLIEPEGLGVWTSVDLTGLEVMWVTFRRKFEPLGANEVRPLALAAAAVAPAKAVAGSAAAGTHYVFVAGLPPTLDDLLALVAFAGRSPVEIGQDLQAAVVCTQVLLLDDGGVEGSATELRLLMRDVRVERARSNWRTALAAL